MKDWYAGTDAADALNKLDWNPISINDTIHLYITKRNGLQLKKMWENSKTVLLEDVSSNNYIVIENALFAFIAIGNIEIIPILIEHLNTKGTKTTAEAYLNCSNAELANAAKAWAKKNGFNIVNYGGKSPVSWGSW